MCYRKEVVLFLLVSLIYLGCSSGSDTDTDTDIDIDTNSGTDAESDSAGDTDTDTDSDTDTDTDSDTDRDSDSDTATGGDTDTYTFSFPDSDIGTDVEADYVLVMEPPNGYRIPKIIGASGTEAPSAGYDYFDWFGISHHRLWWRRSMSTLTQNSDNTITTAGSFETASEAIRKNPSQQGTAFDYYIDWKDFNDEFEHDDMPEKMSYLAGLDIEPMIISTVFGVNADISDDWVEKFRYWKYWYAMVYYFSSRYDVTMYEFKNEPHAVVDYDTWESHWLVAADAMRKGMADANRDFGKSLEVNICGPTHPGVYWDYDLPDPYADIHGWGSVGWGKIKYDIYGHYDADNPMNYGSYDFHRYGENAGRAEEIILNARTDIADAKNDPSDDIPLVITEYNTTTGGNADSRKVDTEDLLYGISMAQILEASASNGPDGLGDDGGIFIFKLGARQSGSPLVGLGNKLSYTSQNTLRRGGITRGGACFQLYASHFGGGKQIVPFAVTAGEDDHRRTIAVVDEKAQAYYIYGSNITGGDDVVSIDLSALSVEAGGMVMINRVDEKNTGQITELFALNESKTVTFRAPDYTAFMVTVPMENSIGKIKEIAPVDDTYQIVSETGNHGSEEIMNVSMHHLDATKRKAGLVKFDVPATLDAKRVLLKLAGKNTGTDQNEREILHVYGVSNDDWNEDDARSWIDTPGVGTYRVDADTIASADGTGEMVDIEDNYGGYTSGTGTGLGINGKFVGAISFFSSSYEDDYLDVTDYIKSLDSSVSNVTFVIARIVRYNVNEYENSYYTLGDYHYDGRNVELGTKENSDETLWPRLILVK